MRAIRWFSPMGRFYNRLLLNVTPRDIIWSNGYVVLKSNGSFTVYTLQGEELMKESGSPLKWIGDQLLVERGQGFSRTYCLLDVSTDTKVFCDEEGGQLIAAAPSGKLNGVEVEGDAYYAMDGDESTVWKIGPATQQTMSSTIVIEEDSTLVVKGIGDASVTVEVNGDSQSLSQSPLLFAVTAGKVKIIFSRGVPEDEGEIRKIEIES